MYDIDRVALLRKAFPDIDDATLLEIGQVARIASYPPDTILCYEGEQGDKFYLISEGEIEITKKFTAQEERVMRTGRAGDYFGEMALLDDAPRTATIRTTSPTVVLELDRSDFEAALRNNPEITLTLVRTISKRMRVNDARAIEEIREQKEELEIAYAELQRQEKQRNEFLNTLAHELRTPLTTTSGYLQLLKAGLLQGEAMMNAIDRIDDSFKRVISLINDLLFVQQQLLVEFSLVDVDLLDVLEGVYNELEDKARKAGMVVQTRTLTPVPMILGDAAGLTRAFRHLLDNAIKFSPGQKEVEINVGIRAQQIEINFIDHGVGIPPEFMSRLFTPFERIETVDGHLFDGAGLGLPIAKQIIERHGGSITARSERNKGTTFTVRLPLERN